MSEITVPSKMTVLRSVKLARHEPSSSGVEETIAITKFETQPMIIHFQIESKRTENYNSMGVSVGVSMPCYVEEQEEALEVAMGIVKARMAKEIDNIESVLGGL